MYEKLFKIRYQGKELDIDAIIIKGALLNSCAYLKEDELEVVEISQQAKINWNKIFANCTFNLDGLFKCMMENGQMDINSAVVKKWLAEKDDSKMEIKKGLFVRCQHDLYAGIPIYGVFHDRHTAEVFAAKRRKDKYPFWDEIEIFEGDYVEIDGNIYPLCNENRAIKPIVPIPFFHDLSFSWE